MDSFCEPHVLYQANSLGKQNVSPRGGTKSFLQKHMTAKTKIAEADLHLLIQYRYLNSCLKSSFFPK